MIGTLLGLSIDGNIIIIILQSLRVPEESPKIKPFLQKA
jgi:hypothetical protein